MSATETIVLLRPGQSAPHVRLRSTDNLEVDLSDYWQNSERGAATIFLRHFGCIFCREHLIRLRKRYDEFTIPVVTIGLGTAEDAAGMRDWLKIPFPILATSTTEPYAAWGLGRATSSTMLNPGTITSGIRALSKGARQGKATGDSMQLPGSFLVDQAGSIRWAHPGSHPGDIASVDELLAAIEGTLTPRDAQSSSPSSAGR
jgi:peroxiredoxin